MDKVTIQSCEYFYDFYHEVLSPCVDEFLNQLHTGPISKLFAVEKTIILASTLDYIRPIWDSIHPMDDGKKWKAHQVAEKIDGSFGIEGSHYINYKFRLVHGMANAIKHRALDPKHDLKYEYGDVTFMTLSEQHESVFFDTPTYKFDYCRVILRPICEAFESWRIEDKTDVLNWLNQDKVWAGHLDDIDGDPIDAMIDACNPLCLDCGEDDGQCHCQHSVYDNEQGEFQSDINPMFDFDTTMAQISGAYKKD